MYQYKVTVLITGEEYPAVAALDEVEEALKGLLEPGSDTIAPSGATTGAIHATGPGGKAADVTIKTDEVL